MTAYIPPYTVVAANSLVNKKFDIPEKCILAGQPAELVKTGEYRDPENDKIVYN